MNNLNRKYSNTADKQTTWFVIFFIMIALTIAVLVAALVKIDDQDFYLRFVIFFAISIPLSIGLAILAIYLTSSKIKAKKGYKKLDMVLNAYSKDYQLIKDISVDKDHKLDYILLTPYEIYSINVRNFVGYISGMDSEEVWRQAIIFQKKKNALANPIKENIATNEILEKKLGIKLEPVVVLVSGNRGYINSKYLYSPNQLQNELLPNEGNGKYSEKELEALANNIKSL